MSMNLDQARHAMIEQQVRPWEVLDPRVLDTLGVVRREDFVPATYRQLAFADVPLPIGHGEIMMKPVVEGRLLQALAVAEGDEVLEIGTGTGYLTSCLARLGRDVLSIDLHEDFVAGARHRLGLAGVTNVRTETADAFAWQPGRKFDAIAVTAAVALVPERFGQWLKQGGRMFIVHGLSPVQEASLFTWRGDTLHGESLFETDIPYLRGAEPVAQFTL
jgi:protein-L-isoaspartate(D-aspartate) O-methyltransferase